MLGSFGSPGKGIGNDIFGIGGSRISISGKLMLNNGRLGAAGKDGKLGNPGEGMGSDNFGRSGNVHLVVIG